MKKILYIFLWVIIFGGIIFLLLITNRAVNQTPCKQVNIILDYNKSDALISSQDIQEILFRVVDTLKGKPIHDIDFLTINDSLTKIPCLKDVDILTNFEGEISIRICQRRPIVRICNALGNSYYLTEDGKMLNVRPAFPVRVPVANGEIYTPYNETLSLDLGPEIEQDSVSGGLMVYQLFKLSKTIDQDPWLKLFIDQIYVANKEFILIPKIGNYAIVFGSIEDMPAKFSKLKIFIEKGLNKVGWDKYNSINLTYKNQIVCSKN